MDFFLWLFYRLLSNPGNPGSGNAFALYTASGTEYTGNYNSSGEWYNWATYTNYQIYVGVKTGPLTSADSATVTFTDGSGVSNAVNIVVAGGGSEELEEILGDIEGKDATAIKEELEQVADIKEVIKSPDALDTYKDIEAKIIEKANITVAAPVIDPNTHGNFKDSPVSAVGLALNAAAGTEAKLHFSKPPKDKEIAAAGYEQNSSVQVDIKLTLGNTDAGVLAFPIAITVNIPSGIAPDRFRILHYFDDGGYEILTPVLNGDGTCTFIIDRFSVFVFANMTESAAAAARKSAHLPPVVPIIYDVVKTGDEFTFKTIIANGYGTGSMAGATATITLNDKYSTVVTIGQDGIGRGTISAPGFAGSMAAFSGRVNGSSGGVVNQFMTVRSDGTVVRA